MKLNSNYKDNLNKIEYLYLNAFPKNERKPFDLILEKCNNGSMEIISIQNDNNNFLGFAIMILHDDMVLLDYFAVAPESRGQNVGSTALKLLFERYKNKRFILEIENTEIECDNLEERKRRKSFYIKNGMSVMPFKVNLIRHLHTHMGMIMGFIIDDTGLWPNVLGLTNPIPQNGDYNKYC